MPTIFANYSTFLRLCLGVVGTLILGLPSQARAQQASFVVHTGQTVGTVRPGVFGVNGPDKYIDWTQNASIGLRLKEGGFKVVRLGLVQDGIYQHRDIYPRKDQWDFKALDAMLKTVFDSGAEPLITIVGFPAGVPHHLGEDAKIESADWNAYAHFVSGVVKRYNVDHALGARRSVRYWEFWNEPTNEPDGKFTSRTQYAEFVHAVAPAMRKLDPNVRLIGPVHAWSDLGEGGWVSFAAKELGDDIDLLCWHDYGGGPDQSDSDRMAWPRAHYGDNVRLVGSGGPDKRFVGANGKRFGTAITEYNMSWQSGSEEYNARYHSQYDAAYVGASLVQAIQADLDIFCFYDLVQEGKNHLGMLDNKTFQPYAPYDAFRLLSTSLEGQRLNVEGEAAGIEVVATSTKAGEIAVAFVNTRPESAGIRFSLEGLKTDTKAFVQQVPQTATKLISIPRSGAIYRLPARSVTVITIRK